MIYFTIKDDAKINTHAGIILNEIHDYANKYKDHKFPPGEITINVLNHIASCILGNPELPDDVECFEIKQLSKVYLKG